MAKELDMNGKPCLSPTLDSETFQNFYYLKEELVCFCKAHGLPPSGGKLELTHRIAHFLDTGEILHAQKAASKKRALNSIDSITEDTEIEKDFVCSQKHRLFFKEKIGPQFSFNVAFQQWLKDNPGETYGKAIVAYHEIISQKKLGKTTIGKQFEYNTYIRDFFAANKGLSLEDAIKCWKHKKRLPGHNQYENTDLSALRKPDPLSESL